MTRHTTTGTTTGTTTDSDPELEIGPSNWTGWVAFAAVMLMIAGGMNIIQGVVSLTDDSYYLAAPDGLAVNLSYTTLGWLQVGLGIVLLAIGLGMLRGARVALVLGAIIAGVSAIGNLATIAAYPLWGVVLVAFNIIVIYAIFSHGREMKQLR